MNPKHLHTPASNRARCPVCNQAVYSRSGIHPQCAARQAESPKPKSKEAVAGPAEAVPVGADRATLEPLGDPPTAGIPAP